MVSTSKLLRGTRKLLGEITIGKDFGESFPASAPQFTDLPVTQKEFSIVTAYNLMPKHMNAIVVPGYPPVWAPPPLPVTVPADKGRQMMDPVRATFPTSPLTPLFLALEKTSPEFEMRNIDLVTDRRNLRALLALLPPAAGMQELRIDGEVCGQTVMLSVWTGLRGGGEHYADGKSGCGKGFEDAFTKKRHSVRNSIAHHRVASYEFAGLKVLMRFEVDGCDEAITLSESSSSPISPKISRPEDDNPPKPAKNKKKQVTGNKQDCRVITSGTLVPAHQIIELKTWRHDPGKCSSFASKRQKALQQAWFSQTPILIEGGYKGDGIFDTGSIKRRNIIESNELQGWEERNSEKLRELRKLLWWISEVVLGDRAPTKAKKFVIVSRKGSSKLEVFEMDTHKYTFGLPGYIKNKHWK